MRIALDEAVRDGVRIAEFPTTVEAAKESHENGIGVMMGGPNFDALAEMAAATRLPVIASGGVSTIDHVRQLADAGVLHLVQGRG